LLGLILSSYGFVQIGLNSLRPDSPAKLRICAAWLCPEEFSADRVHELEQFSFGSYSSYALLEFRRALVQNPASAYRWADLGEAEMNGKNRSAAQYCFQRAVALGPGNPIVLFRAANYDFQTGNSQGALRRLGAILRNPDLLAYYEPVFSTYSRSGLAIEQILDQGIPATSVAADAFLRYSINSNNASQAAAVWNWLPGHAPADDRLAGEYISFLIRNKGEREAAETWKKFTASQMPGYREKNFVFNGSFEQEPKAAPLDWGIESGKDVLVSRVQSVAHDGNWSLRLVFEGIENIEFHQVVQDVVLDRGRWRLRAFLKTDGLTTDQGLGFRLFDADDPTRLDAALPALTGNHDWTEMQHEFEVGPETKMVRVELIRHASQAKDNKIAGSAWLDSVEISPIR
jgi:tetratricopeptide (TPR) repeat protein